MVHSKFNSFHHLSRSLTVVMKILRHSLPSKMHTNPKSQWAFPEGSYNKIPATPDVETYNNFGNFNFSADRLAFIDGDQDVWNGLCYHSPLAPVRSQSSDLHPELFITGAGHHWDSSGILDVEAEPQFIREAHRWEIRTVKKWLQEFDLWKSPRKALREGGGG